MQFVLWVDGVNYLLIELCDQVVQGQSIGMVSQRSWVRFPIRAHVSHTNCLLILMVTGSNLLPSCGVRFKCYHF